MRILCVPSGTALLALALMSFPAQAQRSSALSPSTFYENREASFNFDKVDLSALYEEGRRRNPELPSQAVEALIRRNMHFVFFNKINQGHFLVKPAPRQMVSKVEKIVELQAELDGLFEQARLISSLPSKQKARRKLIRKIGDCGRSIQKTFNEYFADYSSAPFLVKCCLPAATQARFSAFLVQTERIRGLLDNEVNRYFFEPTPSVVDVSDYFERYSVSTLGGSLYELSRLMLKGNKVDTPDS